MKIEKFTLTYNHDDNVYVIQTWSLCTCVRLKMDDLSLLIRIGNNYNNNNYINMHLFYLHQHSSSMILLLLLLYFSYTTSQTTYTYVLMWTFTFSWIRLFFFASTEKKVNLIIVNKLKKLRKFKVGK